MSRSILAFFILGTVAATDPVGLAGQDPPAVTAPAFWAMSVADLGVSTEWYRVVFGLERVREVTAPDGSARALVLRRGPLVVELIERASSRPRTELLGSETHDFDAQGLVKVGVFVGDADAWHARLAGAGVEVDAGVMTDERLAAFTFVARDPRRESDSVLPAASRPLTAAGRTDRTGPDPTFPAVLRWERGDSLSARGDNSRRRRLQPAGSPPPTP